MKTVDNLKNYAPPINCKDCLHPVRKDDVVHFTVERGISIDLCQKCYSKRASKLLRVFRPRCVQEMMREKEAVVV